ncbi:MAG: DinB family protein [Phycisphaerales bacterium]
MVNAHLTSDPLDVLLAHDEWGTRMLLERCVPLTRDQFHQRFAIGLGSLHDNLTHIIGTVRRWTDRIDGRTLRPALSLVPGRPDIPFDGGERTPAALLELLGPASADLRAVAAKYRAMPGGLAGLVHLEWPKKKGEKGMNRYTFTRGCCLTHVCCHGTGHRAQCVNMMRQLGMAGLSDDLPDPSVIDWQVAAESPPVAV